MSKEPKQRLTELCELRESEGEWLGHVWTFSAEQEGEPGFSTLKTKPLAPAPYQFSCGWTASGTELANPKYNKWSFCAGGSQFLISIPPLPDMDNVKWRWLVTQDMGYWFAERPPVGWYDTPSGDSFHSTQIMISMKERRVEEQSAIHTDCKSQH